MLYIVQTLYRYVCVRGVGTMNIIHMKIKIKMKKKKGGKLGKRRKEKKGKNKSPWESREKKQEIYYSLKQLSSCMGT